MAVTVPVDLWPSLEVARWFEPSNQREIGLLATLRRDLCIHDEDGGYMWAP